MQTNESLHCSCKDAFREYFSTFDGIPKDYKEVEDLHDALYHDDYFVDYNSFILSHADYHRGGAKVQILQITFESDLIDVKFHVENKKDGEDFLMRQRMIRLPSLVKYWEVHFQHKLHQRYPLVSFMLNL